MGTIRKWKWLSVVLLISMVVSACDFSRILTKFPGSTATEEPLQQTETVKPTLDVQEVAGVEAAPFAQYSQVSYQIPDVFKNDYTLPLDAASVTGLDLIDLTDTQIAALLKNGFVVAPPITDPNRMFMEFYQAYESNRYSGVPVFITTDSIFHVYHLVFDKMLRDLEHQSFMAILDDLTAAMVDSSLAQYNAAEGDRTGRTGRTQPGLFCCGV